MANTGAPWDGAAPHEQFFVLITGANSGIGLSIGERLIDEFLATRSLSSHLILLPTTRSPSKSKDTIRSLRSYAQRAAQSPALQSRGDTDASARVHVLSIQLDLCDLRLVYSVADRLCKGTLSNPDGTDGQDARLQNIRLPRIDSLIFNAAYGGWSGCNYPMAIWKILTEGLVQSVTWPTFKMALPTGILNKNPAYNYPSKPTLSEVFCACVFGHYVLAHQLSSILSRPRGSTLPPSRIIWTSSLEALQEVYDPDDIQAIRNPNPYDSAKRLTDILVLTQNLPSVRPNSASYLALEEGTASDDYTPPRMYVTHPGIVASSLFPVPWFLMWAYRLALFIARWIGSPWHTVDAYTGASSPVWVALQEQSALDAVHAERVKWGSSTDRYGRSVVKKTEVDDWGWEGKVEDVNVDEDGVTGVLRKRVGRRRGGPKHTEEDLMRFEELGAEVWDEMEDLRQEWAEILSVQDGSHLPSSGKPR